MGVKYKTTRYEHKSTKQKKEFLFLTRPSKPGWSSCLKPRSDSNNATFYSKLFNFFVESWNNYELKNIQLPEITFIYVYCVVSYICVVTSLSILYKVSIAKLNDVFKNVKGYTYNLCCLRIGVIQIKKTYRHSFKLIHPVFHDLVVLVFSVGKLPTKSIPNSLVNRVD